MIEFHCPHCRRSVRAQPRLVGCILKCPNSDCAKPIAVPSMSCELEGLGASPDSDDCPSASPSNPVTTDSAGRDIKHSSTSPSKKLTHSLTAPVLAVVSGAVLGASVWWSVTTRNRHVELSIAKVPQLPSTPTPPVQPSAAPKPSHQQAEEVPQQSVSEPPQSSAPEPIESLEGRQFARAELDPLEERQLKVIDVIKQREKAVVSAFSPVESGYCIVQAHAYNRALRGPHPVVLLGKRYNEVHLDNRMIPRQWLTPFLNNMLSDHLLMFEKGDISFREPMSNGDITGGVELVVLTAEVTFTDSAQYSEQGGLGQSFRMVRSNSTLTVRVFEAKTAKELGAEEFSGSTSAFPDSVLRRKSPFPIHYEQMAGGNVNFDKVIEWLKRFVFPE
jgi:hypothetical protein